MDNILTRVPVDKMTAKVINQSGCLDEMSLEDQRDCLARAIVQVDEELRNMKSQTYSKKLLASIKELGKRKHLLQNKIKVINKELKEKRINDRDLNEYIISECRSRFTKKKWDEILHAARARKNDEIRKFNNVPKHIGRE